MNRRQLLQRGALMAALAPVVRAAGVSEIIANTGGEQITGHARAMPLLAVHDPAYRRSLEFAAVLQDRGARVLSLEPDALSAWHATLRAACAASSAPRIVGLTTRTDYLVLRDLARSVGLVPLATRDADAQGDGVARRRATLIAWVLGARVQGARVQGPRAGAA